tara:strand:+ start:2093 stop:2446 length:354 start_codon:yes stop_codon:yes gene_type:complete
MANFPTSPEPSFPVRKVSKPNTRTVKFGDGYEHRILFGLNQNPKIFNLKWKNISEAESDTLENFLDDRAVDGASFTYTPHNETTAMQFKCTEWSKNMEYPNRATLQATFTQVFEPAS